MEGNILVVWQENRKGNVSDWLCEAVEQNIEAEIFFKQESCTFKI